MTVTPTGDHPMSPHFSFFEMTRTDQPGLQAANRIVSAMAYAYGMALTWGILEPIRRKFGKTSVSSANRCSEVNEKVGGSPTSQHQLFQAADIFKIEGTTLEDLFTWIATSDLPFGQVILEPAAVHISLGSPIYHKSRQTLKQLGSGEYVEVQV